LFRSCVEVSKRGKTRREIMRRFGVIVGMEEKIILIIKGQEGKEEGKTSLYHPEL
jgi:hypothetical protein